LPVEEIFGGGEAELRVDFVVGGVGEVVGVAEFLEAGIFDAAIFFVVGFGGEDGLGAAGEVEAVGAFGVADAGGAGGVLRAVEHDDGVAVGGEGDGGVEGAGGLPGGAAGGEDGILREAGDGEGGGLICGLSDGKERGEKECERCRDANDGGEAVRHWGILVHERGSIRNFHKFMPTGWTEFDSVRTRRALRW